MRPRCFSEDDEVDSKNYTLIAHLEDPPKFFYKNKRAELIVTVTLPQNASLEDPKHVQNALLKLYTRVAYYTNS